MVLLLVCRVRLNGLAGLPHCRRLVDTPPGDWPPEPCQHPQELRS